MRYFLLLTVVLGALYGVLHTGHWTPGTDSEIYLVTARNMLAGRGYSFNGQAFGHYPPGWPVFLAGLMCVSTSFFWLNAMAKVLLIGATLLYYRLLVRITTPWRAFVCMVLAATLWWWFRVAFVLYSESLFLFLFGLGLVLASQIKEGRTQIWRIVSLALLCAVLVSVRWLGVVAAATLCLVPVSGELRPRFTRKWLCFGSAAILALVSFTVLYVGTASGVFVPAEELHSVRSVGVGTEDTAGGDVAASESSLFTRLRGRLRQHPLIFDGGTTPSYLSRVSNIGGWLPRMLWPVTDLARLGPKLTLVINVVGCMLWVLALVYVVPRLWEKQWLWAGALLYVAFLVFRCPRPVGRYLVPFAPLWILAFWTGFETVVDRVFWKGSARRAKNRKRLVVCILILLFAVNAFHYGIAAYVQRASDFYAVYQAGEYGELVDSGRYIADHTPPDARMAVTKQYRNLGRGRGGRLAMAAMALLTDRPILVANPPPGHTGPPNEELIAWAEAHEVMYFLTRPPTSPWRLWHFRVPWLQRWMTGEKDIPYNPYWVLYRIDENGAEEVDTPAVKGWPTHVPPIIDDGATSRRSD